MSTTKLKNAAVLARLSSDLDAEDFAGIAARLTDNLSMGVALAIEASSDADPTLDGIYLKAGGLADLFVARDYVPILLAEIQRALDELPKR